MSALRENPTGTNPTGIVDPPARVLLCLEDCHGEFYLPLGLDEHMVCPVDPDHTVAVYSGPLIHAPTSATHA